MSSILRGVLLLGVAALSCNAAILTNNFSSNPLANGWLLFGNTNLFKWNSTNQNVEATWDSSKTNSYFYIPLGTVLNRGDDFAFELDLRVNDIVGGNNAAKPAGFELSFGFLNVSNATKTNFYRGTGRHSPNLFEFDFFPDTGFGPTIWPSVWSTNSTLSYNSDADYSLIQLPIGVAMHVSMSYTASNKTVKTSVKTNGVSIGTINDVTLMPTFTDFRVDAFAIESYSDYADDGSIIAHGTVDNVLITLPPLPVQNLKAFLSNNVWQASFTSRTNWSYVLERGNTFLSWVPSSIRTNGTGGTVVLLDTNAISPTLQFYRVRAERQ